MNIFFSYVRRRSLSPPRRYFSSISTTQSLQKLRESALVQRFNDLYSRDRLNATNLLRTVSDDYEMNQRICFNVMQVNIYDQYFLFIFLCSFRKLLRYRNVILLIGNYVFVLNWLLHL